MNNELNLISVQTILCNLKVGSAAIFHKTIELTSTITGAIWLQSIGLIPNLAKSP